MMLTQNAKMKKATLKSYNFDTPAEKTCPQAGECKAYCFGKGGFYKFPVVEKKHYKNFLETKKNSFVINMVNEIKSLERKKTPIEAVRVHSVGDYYNERYLLSWFAIMKYSPNVAFYSYTKSVRLFLPYIVGDKKHLMPDNFKVIFSYGGKEDHLIDQYNLRSCRLVDQYSDYATTSDDDDSMIVFSNENIELIKRKVK